MAARASMPLVRRKLEPSAHTAAVHARLFALTVQWDHARSAELRAGHAQGAPVRRAAARRMVIAFL